MPQRCMTELGRSQAPGKEAKPTGVALPDPAWLLPTSAECTEEGTSLWLGLEHRGMPNAVLIVAQLRSPPTSSPSSRPVPH